MDVFGGRENSGCDGSDGLGVGVLFAGVAVGGESELVFDDERQHYELMQCGWIGLHRVHGSVIHIDLKGDKVWIQFDGTNEHIAQRLMDEGIPQDHIVLGFHAPYKRPLTAFATG